jgi:hypothetical protein
VRLFVGSSGKLHNVYERAVEKILFFPIPGTEVPFIKAVLAVLGIIAALVGLSVYNDGQRDALPSNMPLDKQILYQAKGWRNQRNLYLSCLALALWWMVYTTYKYKAQIARLLEQLDQLQGGAADDRSSRSSASKVPKQVTQVDDVHEIAAPSSNKKKNLQEGEGLAQRKLPKPSAPEE